MKKISKIFALVLALAMVLALGACSAKPATESTAPATESSAPAGDTAAATGTVKAGVLTMGTNAAFPPYEYYEGDKITGIDADIAQAIADKLGLTLSIEDMEFDSIITAIQGGKVDVGLAGMTVTDERKESVDFSDGYATGVQVVIVADGSPIATVDDLFAEGNNYSIGVQRNTTGDLYTTWDLEDAGLATIERFSKGADAVMALKVGKVDCVVIDNEPAKAFVAENEGLKILDTEYIEETYAIAMKKGNTELNDKINAALKELIADGTVQSIIDKYIVAK